MSRINLYYQPLLEQLAHIKQADELVCSAVEAEGVSNWDEPLHSASLITELTKALFSSHSKNLSKQLRHKMAWNNLFSMASESNRDLKNNSTGSGFNISTLIVEYPVQDLISNSLLNDEIFLMTLKKKHIL